MNVDRVRKRRIARGGLPSLAFFLCALLTPPPVFAGTEPEPPSIERQVNMLMAQGRFADALTLAEQSWGPDTPNRELRLDFIRALELKVQGRYAEAAQAMRAILTINPGFTRVRAELAHTLFLAGDYDAARFHFTDLSRNAPSEEARQGFEAYLSATRLRQPYRLGGYVSLAPSSNINSGTSTRTIMLPGPGGEPAEFTLTDESRAVSGVGLSGGLWGERNLFFGEALTLTFAGRFDGAFYGRGEFDKYQLGSTIHLRRSTGRNTYGAGIVGEYYRHGRLVERRGLGGELEFGRALGGGRHVFVATRLVATRFPGASVLDGYLLSATVVGRRPLGPGRYLTLGARPAFERTRAAHHDNDGVALFFAYGREWRGGLITHLEPSIVLRRYLAVNPTFGIRRRDLQAGGAVRLAHRTLNFRGFMPRLEYSYSRLFSTLALQRREGHGVNFMLTREF